MAEVRLGIDLAHPCEQVWRALTDARVLSEWFMPTDLEPREGARFTLDPGTLPGFLGPVEGQLVESVPGQRLVMLWQGEKLHTRVVWELTGTEGGCRFQLVQSGFIGAPAALRGRALRGTYQELFGQRLPRSLAGLATAGFGGLAGASAAAATGMRAHRQRATDALGGESVRRAVQQQRRANTVPAAWSAGRTVRTPAAPAAAGTVAAAPAAGATPVEATLGAATSRSTAPAAGVAGTAVRPAPRPAAAQRVSPAPRAGPQPAWQRWRAWYRPRLDRARGLPVVAWLSATPSWGRALAVAGAAAVAAVLVLAAMVGPAAVSPGDARGPAALDERRNAPGVAVQPESPVTGSPESTATGPGTAGGEPGGSPVPAAPPLPGSSAGPGPTGPPGTSPARPTATADPSLPPPELTARMSTSGLPLLLSRSVAVTIDNPGPGDADGWELILDVGNQNVTNVTGASYERDGALAIFTPLDPVLAAGASVQVGFDIPAPTLGLLGARDPVSCTIDGRPCE